MESVDPNLDLCIVLRTAQKAVVFDGKEICELKKCDSAWMQVACDNIAASIVISGVTKISDTVSFDAVFDLCPTRGKPISISLSFKDTGLTYTGGTSAAPISWEETFS